LTTAANPLTLTAGVFAGVVSCLLLTALFVAATRPLSVIVPTTPLIWYSTLFLAAALEAAVYALGRRRFPVFFKGFLFGAVASSLFALYILWIWPSD